MNPQHETLFQDYNLTGMRFICLVIFCLFACNNQSHQFDDCVLETIDSEFLKKGENFSDYLIQNEVLSDLTYDGLRNLISTAMDDHNSEIALDFRNYEGARGRISDINAIDHCCRITEERNATINEICEALHSYYYSSLDDPYAELMAIVDSIHELGSPNSNVYKYIILHLIDLVLNFE